VAGAFPFPFPLAAGSQLLEHNFQMCAWLALWLNAFIRVARMLNLHLSAKLSNYVPGEGTSQREWADVDVDAMLMLS